MNPDIDPAVLALYRATAREEPGELADARVLAAAAHRRSPRHARWPLWAEAAAVALLAGVAALNLARAPGPPSPDDPRYFGLYAGHEDSILLALGAAPPDPIADALLQAARPTPTLKE